jgi:hypothetical protein
LSSGGTRSIVERIPRFAVSLRRLTPLHDVFPSIDRAEIPD